MKKAAPGLKRARYRVGQFVHGAMACVDAVELAEAHTLLPPDAYCLFAALPVDAQRHSLNVLHALARQATLDVDLASAALLHDVGKLAAAAAGAPIRLWMRGPLVMANRFAPRPLRRFAQRNPRRPWRFAAWVYREHATIGAFLAMDAGCTQRTCLLIALHQTAIPADVTGEFADNLRLLQQVDERM